MVRKRRHRKLKKKKVNHGRPRRYPYLGGENKSMLRYFLATWRTGNRLIEIPIQFCIIPGIFGQGFARSRILGMRANKWGESMRSPSLRCIDPLKTRTYETSQSCDRVHLGHLKKKNYFYFS